MRSFRYRFTFLRPTPRLAFNEEWLLNLLLPNLAFSPRVWAEFGRSGCSLPFFYDSAGPDARDRIQPIESRLLQFQDIPADVA